MMGKQSGQIQMVILDIDSMIPGDHLLRRIKNCVNFDFIYEKAAPCYSHVGRKSIDPVILIKMLLIGYLYGIKSERRLEEEVCPLTLHTAGSVALTLHRECRIIQPLARIDDDAFRMPAYFGKFLMKLYSNACSLGLYQEKRALLTALFFPPMYHGTAVTRRSRP